LSSAGRRKGCCRQDEDELAEELQHEMAARVGSLAPARRALRSWLVQNVDPETACDLLSVASEFLLHALAKADPAAVAVLRATHGAEGVVISVEVETAGDLVRPLARVPADPLRAGGIGHRIVETACDGYEIATAERRMSMRCWRRA
jgi:hypothetical protein